MNLTKIDNFNFQSLFRTGNRQLERRVNELEQRVRQLENTVERHTRRLNRLNQRLRTVENRLNIPFTALEDGF